MKRKTVAALMIGVALAATGCGSSSKETEAETTEAVTTEAATEEETTEAATEEETTEAATEEETTEAATEEETTEAATEEETTEAATEEETTEAATEEETTEAATEEETTEAATEEETTEAATEEETTEAATEEETTEAETEEETTEAETEEETTEAATEEETTEAETEEETTEAETEEETTEAETEEETTEAATEEETTEAATEEETTEAASEEETTEAETEEETTEAASEEESESETETETEYVLEDMPEYTALDYVTLGEYTGLTVEVEPVEVSDEDVESYIASDTLQTLEEGTVEDGDTVDIDYEGKIDGETFDGGSAEGSYLEIGSDTFIDGFEDGLIGVAVGETVDLNLTFPDDYYSEDLAGKDVVFTVTVNSIDRVPELTDEVASEASDGEYTTVEDYKEAVRAELEESEKESQESTAKSDLVAQVYENSTISGYPTDNLDYVVAYAKNYYTEYAELMGVTLEELIEVYGYTEDDFMTELEEMAKESLSQEMILKAIAETEGMELTDEEYTEGLQGYADSFGMEADELEEEYGENYIRNSLILEKAMDFLYENATVVETEAAEEDTEEAAEEETTEAETEEATEEETEEAATEEETTEAETEEETTEAASEAETETETETESES